MAVLGNLSSSKSILNLFFLFRTKRACQQHSYISSTSSTRTLPADSAWFSIQIWSYKRQWDEVMTYVSGKAGRTTWKVRLSYDTYRVGWQLIRKFCCRDPSTNNICHAVPKPNEKKITLFIFLKCESRRKDVHSNPSMVLFWRITNKSSRLKFAFFPFPVLYIFLKNLLISRGVDYGALWGCPWFILNNRLI